MAETYEKRSGKATRQKYVKDRRDKVVQVRMSDAELPCWTSSARRARVPIFFATHCTRVGTRRPAARWFWTSRPWTVSVSS